jgi:AraC-like DNA-binding protein
MAASLCIDAMPAARRAAAWRDAVCDTFVRLECTPDRHAPLHGRLDATVFGDLHAARVVSSPQRVERTAARAATADEAYVLMSVQMRGRTVVRQGNAEADLTPGCLAFYDTTRPYTLTLPNDFDQIVLHMPHAALERAVPGGLDHMAQRIDATNPFAQAIVAVAPQLLRASTQASPALAQRTAAVAQELIELALASLMSSPEPPAAGARPTPFSGVGDSIVWRARDVMGRRLADMALTPAGVASEVGVSLRRLQESFQQQGCTVVDTLWEMRLDLARSMLAGQPQLAVGDVAERAGFADAAHFSHRFRQRFGLSPREYRRVAQAKG